ncbi:hypothetical protein [Cellulosimicrobium sp. 22601]|uniref:hypothetical protein n=1 Tax=unclassified Cellulosimicrobium TaxID=2624466 RepID=UPI003F82C3D3
MAQLMLGFWVNLLDAGGTVGRSEPQSFKMNYEDLWRDCVHQAFRGGRAVANQRQEQFTRSWTHEIASTVQTVRNRCAHHEPLLRGIPLPGQSRRISAQEGYDAYVLLLRIINQDLATWVESNSAVATVLACRPQP